MDNITRRCLIPSKLNNGELSAYDCDENINIFMYDKDKNIIMEKSKLRCWVPLFNLNHEVVKIFFKEINRKLFNQIDTTLNELHNKISADEDQLFINLLDYVIMQTEHHITLSSKEDVLDSGVKRLKSFELCCDNILMNFDTIKLLKNSNIDFFGQRDVILSGRLGLYSNSTISYSPYIKPNEIIFLAEKEFVGVMPYFDSIFNTGKYTILEEEIGMAIMNQNATCKITIKE